MKYGIYNVNGTVICDPVDWDAGRMRDIITRYSGIAGNVPATPNGYAYYCGNLVLAPERITEHPKPSAFAYLYEKRVSSWSALDGVLERVISWVEVTDSERKEELIAAEKTKAKLLIDQEAGEARQRFVSEGYLVEEEYRLALQQATVWIDSGKEEPTPECIAAWASASGMTDDEAADNIIQTSALWDTALAAIRALRLNGKAVITNLADNQDINVAAGAIVDQIKAVKP